MCVCMCVYVCVCVNIICKQITYLKHVSQLEDNLLI